MMMIPRATQTMTQAMAVMMMIQMVMAAMNAMKLRPRVKLVKLHEWVHGITHNDEDDETPGVDGEIPGVDESESDTKPHEAAGDKNNQNEEEDIEEAR